MTLSASPPNDEVRMSRFKKYFRNFHQFIALGPANQKLHLFFYKK